MAKAVGAPRLMRLLRRGSRRRPLLIGVLPIESRRKRGKTQRNEHWT